MWCKSEINTLTTTKQTCTLHTCKRKKIFLIETLQFRLRVQGIDWVICMCCWCSWNVSKNMCWWMCLWLGSACEGYRVDAGNALTASRLPAVHQNRWMPLIVTVSNVLNSIIPSLSRPMQHLPRSLMEAARRKPELHCASTASSRNRAFVCHAGRNSTSYPGCSNRDVTLPRYMLGLFSVY